MTQYFTDFSEYGTGSQPSDWTEQWDNSGSPWSVVSLGGGVNALRINRNTNTNTRRALTWDAVGSVSGNVEIVAKWRFTSEMTNNNGSAHPLRLHVSGSGGAETAYYFTEYEAGNTYSLGEYTSGSFATHDDTTFSRTQGTWYWSRLQRTSTTLRVRTWADGDSEPGTWDLSATDATLSSGYVGVGNFGDRLVIDYDVIGVGTGGDAAPTEELNTAPTFSVQPSVDYGAGVALTPTNTPVTINFTAEDVDGGTLDWELVGGYPGSPEVLDSGTTTEGVAETASLAYSNSFFSSTDGTYSLRVIVSDGVAADVVSDEFFVSRASPPSTPPGTYVIRFNPSDILSTDSDELSWEIRTATAGGGNLVASGDATAGVLVETDPITDAYIVNGTNTRYVRLYDGAGNYDDASFEVEAELTQEYFVDYQVTTGSTLIFDKLAARTRTHNVTTTDALSMARNLSLWFVLAVTAALTTSKHFVRQTLATITAGVTGSTLAARFRAFLISAGAAVTHSRLLAAYRSFVVSMTAQPQMQQARSFFRSALVTTGSAIERTLRQGISVTYLVTTQPDVAFDRLATLVRTLIVTTSKHITREMDISAFILKSFIINTAANINVQRFFDISMVYTITVQAATSVHRGIAWLRTIQVTAQVSTLRDFFKNFTVYIHASAAYSALAARYKAFLVSTGTALAYVRGVGITLPYLVTTSAVVRQFRSALRSFVVQAGITVSMARNLSLIRSVTSAYSMTHSKLVTRSRTYVVTTAKAISFRVGTVLEKVLRVRTSAALPMTRHIRRFFAVTTGAAVLITSFLRKVRDFWSVHIYQELEWSTTTINSTDEEFTFIILPDEWTTTLYADGVLQQL